MVEIASDAVLIVIRLIPSYHLAGKSSSDDSYITPHFLFDISQPCRLAKLASLPLYESTPCFSESVKLKLVCDGAGQVCNDFICGPRSADQRETKATGKLEGMSRNGGAQAQHPPATASGDRLAVIASHLSHSWLGSPAHVAGEKEAALAAEPFDGPTM